MICNKLQRRGDGCILLFFLIIILAPLIFVGVMMLYSEHKREQASKERHVIEGTVAKVESYKVDPPKPPDNEDDKKRSRINITIGGASTNERLKVTFKDNRHKEFVGISPKPLEVDKFYIITYDGLNTILQVEENNGH
jgi:hypothetical protein